MILCCSIPLNLVFFVETFPSSGPGIRMKELMGLMVRSPAMIRVGWVAGPRVFMMASWLFFVPRVWPPGPLILVKRDQWPSLSTISEPWFGGASWMSFPASLGGAFWSW